MQVCMPEVDDDERIQATAGRLPVLGCGSFLRRRSHEHRHVAQLVATQSEESCKLHWEGVNSRIGSGHEESNGAQQSGSRCPISDRWPSHLHGTVLVHAHLPSAPSAWHELEGFEASAFKKEDLLSQQRLPTALKAFVIIQRTQKQSTNAGAEQHLACLRVTR